MSLYSPLDCTLNYMMNTIRKCFYKYPDEAVCSLHALEGVQTKYLKSVVLCLPIMVPELCFYFYKMLLWGFLHQIGISVYVWLWSILGV